MDTKEIAEVVSGVLEEHTKLNGSRNQKSLWLRALAQVVLVSVIVTGGYFALRGDVDTNTTGIRTNCVELEKEVKRSKGVEDKRDVEMKDIGLKVNTIEIQQNNILINQMKIEDDVEEVDDKMDEVLRRLPK